MLCCAVPCTERKGKEETTGNQRQMGMVTTFSFLFIHTYIYVI